MKRMIALLLVFGMMAMLCACGSSTDEPAQSTAAAAQSETQSDAQTEAQDESQSEAQDESQSENAAENAVPEDGLVTVVKEILGNAISLADYELSDQDDEDEVHLYLLEEAPIEFDYTIALDDGTTITLPMVYGEFLDTGWANRTSWKEQAEAHASGYGVHANANGDTVSIGVVNPTDETMEPADIWINSVNVGGSYTAGFNICGISRGSSIADVINALGNPTTIYYTCDDDYESFALKYSTPEFSLLFEINVENAVVDYVGCSISNDSIG